MKAIFVPFFMLLFKANAQDGLAFNRRFVESEDKWVALRGKPVESYSYGFIYLDPQAGFTMQVGGRFTIDAQGKYSASPLKENMKVRLQPNQVKVALIPSNKLVELDATPVPEWLNSYKGDTTTAAHFYRWGFTYNAWEYPAGAVRFLKKGYQIDPKYDNLGLELGYTYNAVGQYDKAVEVLRAAQPYCSDKCYFYKEFSYAQMNGGQLAEAAKTAREGISACNNKELKSEMAYNITYQYYLVKDKANFELWAKEIEKWAVKGDRFMMNLDKMKKNGI